MALSWEIIYHIQYAQIYAKYGLVLTESPIKRTCWPKNSLSPTTPSTLAFLGVISEVDFFQIARAMQPFLAMFIVLSVTYVAPKVIWKYCRNFCRFFIDIELIINQYNSFATRNLALIFFPYLFIFIITL